MLSVISFDLLGQSGRLGNQLWQIAGTLGIADLLQEEVLLPRWAYEEYFCVPPELFVDQLPQHRVQAHETPLLDHIDERARAYMQDYSLWAHIQNSVREYFQPSPLAMEQLLSYQDFWFLEPPVLALHVRRGDNTDPKSAPYHPLRPFSYYEEALESVTYESLAVFSDDPEWCRLQFGEKADFIFEGTPRPKEHEPEYATAPVLDWIDLQLMTFCDFHIISNSTYSWWGAFLSDDPSPVYPAPWFGRELRYIDEDLMFPDNWTCIWHGAP